MFSSSVWSNECLCIISALSVTGLEEAEKFVCGFGGLVVVGS